MDYLDRQMPVPRSNRRVPANGGRVFVDGVGGGGGGGYSSSDNDDDDDDAATSFQPPSSAATAAGRRDFDPKLYTYDPSADDGRRRRSRAAKDGVGSLGKSCF